MAQRRPFKIQLRAVLASAVAVVSIAAMAANASAEPSLTQSQRQNLMLELGEKIDKKGPARDVPGLSGYTIDLATGTIDFYWQAPPSKAQSAILASPPAGITVRQHSAPYSAQQLEAARDRLLEAIPGQFTSIVVPPEGTSLVVGSEAGASRRTSTNLQDLAGVPVITVTEELPATAAGSRLVPRPNWTGGSIYFTPGDGVCTMGFGAEFGSQEVMLTAAHCGPGAMSYNGGSLGSMSSSTASYKPTRDVGLIALSGGRRGDGYYFQGGITSSSRLIVRDTTNIIKGMSLCVEGGNSGEHCGAIVQNPNTSVYYADRNLTVSPVASATRSSSTSVAVVGGDSGGPVVASAGVAAGIISGGGGTVPCPATNYGPGLAPNGAPACYHTLYFAPIIPTIGAFTNFALHFG